MSVWVANRLLPMPSSAAWRDMGETCPPPSPRTSSKDEPGRSRWVCVPAAARVAVTRIAGLATFIVVATGMTAEPADADNVYAPARAAFAEGRYREAADLAETVGNATGYALAAESLAVEGHYLAGDELAGDELAGDEQRPSLLQRAMHLAERAVRLAPEDPEAHFQLAHAMGCHAQSISPMKALREGYVGRSRAAIETALRLDPDMVHARLSLGSWHADMVARAGRFVARTAYGATRKAAIENYERALELAPDDKIVQAEVARGLLALGRREHRIQARELLSIVVGMPSGDAFEQIIHKEAELRLAALDSD